MAGSWEEPTPQQITAEEESIQMIGQDVKHFEDLGAGGV